MIVASPDTEAHSPEELRKEMLMCGSDSMSLVLPDSVFVKKRRFTPPLSCFFFNCDAFPPLVVRRGERGPFCQIKFIMSKRILLSSLGTMGTGKAGKGTRGGGGDFTCAATAIHLEDNKPLSFVLVVIIPNFEFLINATRSSIFSLRDGLSLLASL